MIESSFTYLNDENNEIFVYQWLPNGDVKAVLQIFHGMAEHAGRYIELAEFMTGKSVAVYAADHRGHGRSVKNLADLGYLGKAGFYGIVEDGYLLTKIIKEKHHEVPNYLLGHSMGSFVAQEYISKYGNQINGVIISGSAAQFDFDVPLAAFISKVERIFRSDKRPSHLMDFLCFHDYNKKFKAEKIKFAWLNRIRKEVEKYENDPFCGTVFPINFFVAFLNGLKNLHKKEKVAKISKDMPVYIFSGDNDPVGKYGRLTTNLYNLYKHLEIKDLRLKLYLGGRHEMLHEINKQEVFADIYKWLDERINSNYS